MKRDPGYVESSQHLVAILCVHRHLLRFVRHIPPHRIQTFQTRLVFRVLLDGGDPLEGETRDHALALLIQKPDATRFLLYKAMVEEPN